MCEWHVGNSVASSSIAFFSGGSGNRASRYSQGQAHLGAAVLGVLKGNLRLSSCGHFCHIIFSSILAEESGRRVAPSVGCVGRSKGYVQARATGQRLYFVTLFLSMLSGTIINVLTVLVGGSLGRFLGNRLPERVQTTIFDGLGLITLLVGIQQALGTANVLILLGSTLLGGLIGEALRIESRIERFGDWVQGKLTKDSASRFSEAFVTSSLLFCVGPLTITGSLENGLVGNYRPLALKAMLDGFASFAFAASLGWGVLASTLTILVFQGGLSLGAGLFAGILDAAVIRELTAAGGLLIMGIGIQLLRLKRIAVANFLPSLLIAPLLVLLLRELAPLLPTLP